MAKKEKMVGEFLDLITTGRAKELNGRLWEMTYELRFLNGGCWTCHNMHDNYHYLWFMGMLDHGENRLTKLYGKGMKRATVWEFGYHLEEFKKSLDSTEALMKGMTKTGWREPDYSM